MGMGPRKHCGLQNVLNLVYRVDFDYLIYENQLSLAICEGRLEVYSNDSVVLTIFIGFHGEYFLICEECPQNFASMEKYIEDEELREMYEQKAANMTEEEELMMVPVDIIRKAVKLGLSLGGHNTSEFAKKTVKLISPRFMSVLPEDEELKKDELDILSPSLFSLHDSGTDIEKNTSFASL
uniref:Uncharacterized protein n=2 Tax=Caenorhabditis japonica TaxID=281687 RepID=A0A8R1IPU1_CAEJA